MVNWTSLKQSKYILSTSLPNGDTRLMHTLWRSAVDLDLRIMSLVSGEATNPSEQELQDLQTMYELGLLVEPTLNEFKQACDKMEEWRESEYLNITFLPTYQCNMHCVYCVQQGNYTHRPTMSQETLQASLKWIYDTLEMRKCKGLWMDLFGGEPMMGYDILLSAMKQVSNYCVASGRSCKFHMVTNGVLLDADKLDILKQLGLSDIQFTIDGLRESHNRRRYTGQDTFDLIWSNVIEATAREIIVFLNCVVDEENQAEMESLIDYAEQLGPEHPSLKTHIVFTFSTLIPTVTTQARCKVVWDGHQGKHELRTIAARAYARSKGFETTDPFSVVLCARETRHNFLLDPLGNIYKCFGSVGDTRYKVGDVFQRSDQIEALAERMVCLTPISHPDCQECNIFPLCRGGCQFESSQYHAGEYGHQLCYKSDLLPALEFALKEGVFYNDAF